MDRQRRKQAEFLQVFVHRHRVHYAECTLGNHIYYARYLDLLEDAPVPAIRAPESESDSQTEAR
jgi:acyl-CoA thioesterase FadM